MKNHSLTIIALAISAAALFFSFQAKSKAKIAFVDTNRLMTAFKEAHTANGEIKAEDEKWKATLKIMEDSLKSFMDSMTVKYDKAPMEQRKALQEELNVRNQQIGNFQNAQTRKMGELAQKKMAVVYEKINAMMKEFGKARSYEIVFGTGNGNILYGEGTSMDITDEVIKELNKRYE